MDIFIIAILISIVLRSISGFVVNLYLSLDNKEHLHSSLMFNVSVLVYVINTGLILINTTILAALAIKTYLL
jgi:magnesium-transporting ATPase (P-type)